MCSEIENDGFSISSPIENDEGRQNVVPSAGQDMMRNMMLGMAQEMMQGADRARARSIQGMADTLSAMRFDKEEICRKLMETYSISREQAEQFIRTDD